ncbi:glutathione S-transferase [Cricetibacter osteomyelitidis]|uniref:glutathione transferase n=1 Tax=Cricetibacter osteomyelitidis TaxID=1521931 RepID=A0A4R2T1J7_9PAST|nr:glutathione S-transferase [Cricetibacter osteomyelitidis]TCP96010.1 glutathione S-transferase [Cricetibacter osteomyelitidis]
MITLHYLERSCSHRIVWLLEALGLEYELKMYQRLPETQLAPPELKAQHPLGKAPVLQDGDLVLAEGNAIIQHLLDRYGNGRFVPPSQTDDYSRYIYWLAVSASMFSANLLALMAKQGDFGAYNDYANAQVGIYFDHVEQTLNGKTWIVGSELTGADFGLSFPLQWGVNYVEATKYPNIARYLKQIATHPDYVKANERTAGALNLSKF